MKPKTLRFLEERKWIPLTRHLDSLEPEEQLNEMARLTAHLNLHYPNPAQRKKAVNAVVWDYMLTRLKQTPLAYTPERVQQALDIVESAIKHRGECVLELVPEAIEKIHTAQMTSSAESHQRMLDVLDRLSTHGLAKEETHIEAKALKIHLENRPPSSRSQNA